MSRVLSASYPILSFLFLLSVTCFAKKIHRCDKPPSCGNIENISYPFGIEGDPNNCGDPNYLLACENNNTVLKLFSRKYYVRAIHRNNKTIRVVDAGLQQGNCSSLPLFPLTADNFSSYFEYPYQLSPSSKKVTFMNCENPVDSPLFVDTQPCVDGVCNSKYSFASPNKNRRSYSYVVFGDVELSQIPDLCSVDLAVVTASLKKCDKNCSYLDVFEELLYGFQLSWSEIYCEECQNIFRDSRCKFNDDFSEFSGCYGEFEWYIFLASYIIELLLIVALKCLSGTACIATFLITKWRRRHLSMYDTIEEFLRSHNNLMPIMYSYSDIKKMTGGFKDKLGEGGYGSIYKGKLASGRIVAIKILGKSKANGQEFINEVATIGRIHHTNIVQLIGFCAERSKRALVYEFMCSGSLEKYIFSQKQDVALSCEKIYEISLDIARGIEYLHRGCSVQILHFDIKPHNILLDEKFKAKVSDFGLAKLYPTENSIVSLPAPRGTMGYMAPELFYKNIGGVSYKADVYSFGMLLMEMAGRRKNLNAFADHSSQIYFPSWVYDQFSDGKDIEIEDATEEEKKLTKKMMIVALWSIQMRPSDRPSMNKIVEMLEGEVESLHMPPKPFLSPQELHQLVTGINMKAPAFPNSSNDRADSENSIVSPT
ncbi:rust resistance kinase Lr10 isoform X1 [Hevea brasiliensis]|nr:rust resistance kinase Lr10 isoform X1 [Hevea brasiliensis]